MSLNHIPSVDVEPTHNDDAGVLIQAIESTRATRSESQALTADSPYSSDDNREQAK